MQTERTDYAELEKAIEESHVATERAIALLRTQYAETYFGMELRKAERLLSELKMTAKYIKKVRNL